MQPDRQISAKVILPEEATQRGIIVSGTLKSAELLMPEILVQFSKLNPFKKKAKVHIYPTPQQAKQLFGARPPFAFTGQELLGGDAKRHYVAHDIWLGATTQFGSGANKLFSSCSGELSNLRITTDPGYEPEDFGSASAWLVARECQLLKLLATGTEDENESLRRLNIHKPPLKFPLPDGSIVHIKRVLARHSHSRGTETKKYGYVLEFSQVADIATVKRTADLLLILASLASRERTHCWYWSTQQPRGSHEQHWQFNLGTPSSRPKGIEPLITGNRQQCSDFFALGSVKLLHSQKPELFEAAVYALLEERLTLEVRIARLFSGIESALRFACPALAHASKPRRTPSIHDLYTAFNKSYRLDLTDLWPLLGKTDDTSLQSLRNFAVHGDVFTEEHFEALSYASEHLQWTLERILLAILGWNIDDSAVSERFLRRYTAHNWKMVKSRLTL